jgi:site-specific recombinase XerD
MPPRSSPQTLPAAIQEVPLAVAPDDRVRGTVGRGAVSDTARHPALVYLARLAPGSRRTMEGALATAARALGGDEATILTFPWPALRYQHTAALRAACWDRYTPATTNKLLAAVRGVLREAWRLHLIEAEDYTRAADVRGVRAATLLRGRALSTGEIRSLFAHCAGDPSVAGVRDAALLGVLYGAGLRRAEAVALNVGDYDPATAALRVERGKGRKARVSYVRGGAAAALEEWLALRESGTATSLSAALFTRLRKGGTVTALRLTDSGVMHVLQHRALAAGVPPFSPHDVRRTFIGDLLDAGADISTVQRLAGHANVQTTARYDRRGERTKHAAAGLLHVPYTRRRD